MNRQLLNTIFASFMLFYFIFTSVAQADTLKVATFNVGMLNFGSPIPFLEERQTIFGEAVREFLNSSDIDVLAVQEAWTQSSINTLKTVHENYEFFNSDSENNSLFLEHDTGVGFLVKKSIGARSIFFATPELESRFCGWGAVCGRGFQVLSFKKNEKQYFILNTHLTPFYYMQEIRAQQISELNNLKFRIFLQYPEADVIITGDFNISPTFGPFNEEVDEGAAVDWQSNANLFSGLLEGFGVSQCLDTYNVALESSLETPYSQDRERSRLTALSNSTKLEPSQRLDHIIYCSKPPVSEGKVLSIEHIFTERHSLSSGEYELSDHYGVMVEFSL